ncbi:mucin TcMUCII [Trypanosoma cruzi]|uniref:Mucin TcMUCII n=1 Tax=Trypanosoma cruzi TaxID=5693 RepID=A0A7J6XZH1_TRYCR|nr:mucin TcMUCII [Trypanosoma cruzi]
MRAHARRAQPGVIIVGEGLPCGCHNGATVFLTGASRAGRHRSCQACQQARHAGSTNAGTRDGPGSSATASSRTPRAADPPTDHGRLCLIHCGNAPSLGTGTATVWDCPSPHDGPFATEYLPLLYGRPLRYSLVIVAAYNQNKIISCFCDGYWLHFPWTNNPRGVRGSPFLLLLCFCVAVCAAPSCVCVRTLREGCSHDGPLSPHVHAVEPCVPLLFASPSSICVLVLRQGCVCVCLLPWIGVCVVRGVRRTLHAWLLPSLHVVCPLCVSAAPLVSSVALHVPHCADQLHTTE